MRMRMMRPRIMHKTEVKNHIKLIQKPTRQFVKQLEATLRDLKRKGFRLYKFAKDETSALFKRVYEEN